MYARIAITKSIVHTLRYNESKLRQGKAECILAENYIKDLGDLTKEDKLYHFQRLNSLNQWSRKHTLHISLNFHPSDRLSNVNMRDITREYMKAMHLSQQPYLAYRHNDSAHPHLHIVSTLIQRNRRKIILERKHYYKSHKITKEIEWTHSLIAWRKGMAEAERQRKNQAQKIIYGKEPTLPALSNVINHVIPNYKYTSLEEFNTVLRLYNVEAYRGKEGSRLYEQRGLIYWILDENGHSTGCHIRASKFDSKPTLKKLEQQFELNKPLQQQHTNHITSAVDWTIVADQPPDLNTFKVNMQKKQITVIPQHDKAGNLRDIFYLDQQSRTVVDGKTLGARYSATAITRRVATQPDPDDWQIRQKLIIPRQRQTQVPRQRHRL